MARLAGECPSEETVLLYLAQRLDASGLDRVREHVVACAACRELVSSEATSATAEDAAPSPLLAGKYAIERELGAGGMGRVFRARHEALGKVVAIKMLHPELLQEPSVIERFTREARAAASLESRHVVQVLDIDVSEQGEPFIVMELLAGTDLETLVRNGGPLPVERALTYVLHACDALAEAHDRGIVHRDIKPSNLFLTAEGSAPLVKVLDFGLVKALPGSAVLGANRVALTARQDLLGSPYFMAPEQFGGKVDHRTDVWSLGVTLYYLLTGAHPFGGKTVAELRDEILAGVPVPIAERRSDLPADLVAVIDRCLRRLPDARFSDIRQLAAALLAARETSKGEGPRRASSRALPFDLGRYTVLRVIASGGMGTVYLARVRGALGFSRLVALKQLHAHLAQTGDTRRRFLEEARLVSHVDHPHIVKVLDVVEDDDDVFLVLEYVHGETLEWLLRAARTQPAPVPLGILVTLFSQVAEALHAAHEAVDASGVRLGIVHRDISPHNVLVARQGSAYVTDFGIAKVRAPSGDAHSQDILGKAGYMAPEQLRGERVTPAADVFAFGIMLWEALTRRRAFTSLEERMRSELNPDRPIVPPPSTLDPAVPLEIDALVLSMTARRAEDRPPAARAISARLRALVAPADSETVAAWVARLSSGRLEKLEEALTEAPSVGAGATPPSSPAGLTDTIADTPMRAVPAVPAVVSVRASAEPSARGSSWRRAALASAFAAGCVLVAYLLGARQPAAATGPQPVVDRARTASPPDSPARTSAVPSGVIAPEETADKPRDPSSPSPRPPALPASPPRPRPTHAPQAARPAPEITNARPSTPAPAPAAASASAEDPFPSIRK